MVHLKIFSFVYKKKWQKPENTTVDYPVDETLAKQLWAKINDWGNHFWIMHTEYCYYMICIVLL